MNPAQSIPPGRVEQIIRHHGMAGESIKKISVASGGSISQSLTVIGEKSS